MMSIIMIVYISVMSLVLVFMIKNDVTFAQHTKISRAIYLYCMDQIYKGNLDYTKDVYFEDAEPYYKTLFRLWDWGYKRILPPDKFEIIKTYIEKK